MKLMLTMGDTPPPLPGDRVALLSDDKGTPVVLAIFRAPGGSRELYELRYTLQELPGGVLTTRAHVEGAIELERAEALCAGGRV